MRDVIKLLTPFFSRSTVFPCVLFLLQQGKAHHEFLWLASISFVHNFCCKVEQKRKRKSILYLFFAKIRHFFFKKVKLRSKRYSVIITFFFVSLYIFRKTSREKSKRVRKYDEGGVVESHIIIVPIYAFPIPLTLIQIDWAPSGICPISPTDPA